MPVNIRGRHFLKLIDYTPAEIRYLLDLSRDFKNLKRTGTPHRYLEGKNVVLLFEKTSTRTRCAFEVAGRDLGMGVTYLDPTGSQIGKKESIADTANRMAEGTLWNAGELDEMDALVIMQVHNRDVSATGGLKEKYTDYTAAEIDELWAEREESELTKRLLAENGLPNLAQVFTQRRYVRKDNLAISESYFALLKEKGFFNN